MSIAVMIPTVGRTVSLRNCLNGLLHQVRLADSILVIVQKNDLPSHLVIDEFKRRLTITKVVVNSPGVVHALNAGLVRAKSEVLATLDDDAVSRKDWLLKIEKHFDNPLAGGVGGRDTIKGIQGRKKVVGRITWYGKLIGNHHLGFGEVREVDFIKGVNMSFRTDLVRNIGFDKHLLGQGAQVHYEVALCFAIKRLGYKIIYDPQMIVDHYPARRVGNNQRGQFDYQSHVAATHNETWVVLGYLSSWARPTFIIWSLLLGTHVAPGLIQLIRLFVFSRKDVGPLFRATLIGKIKGYKTWTRAK